MLDFGVAIGSTTLTPAPAFAGGAIGMDRTPARCRCPIRGRRVHAARTDATGSSNLHVINNRYSTIFTPMVGGFGLEDGFWENATTFTGNVYHETEDLLQPCAY